MTSRKTAHGRKDATLLSTALRKEQNRFAKRPKTPGKCFIAKGREFGLSDWNVVGKPGDTDAGPESSFMPSNERFGKYPALFTTISTSPTSRS
jgi:hypothetical protein